MLNTLPLIFPDEASQLQKVPFSYSESECGRTTAGFRSHALPQHFQESPPSHRPFVLPPHLSMSLCTAFGLVSYTVEKLFFPSLSPLPVPDYKLENMEVGGLNGTLDKCSYVLRA